MQTELISKITNEKKDFALEKIEILVIFIYVWRMSTMQIVDAQLYPEFALSVATKLGLMFH